MYCNEECTNFLWIVKYSFEGNRYSLCNLYYAGIKKNFSIKYDNGSQTVMGIPLQGSLL